MDVEGFPKNIFPASLRVVGALSVGSWAEKQRVLGSKPR